MQTSTAVELRSAFRTQSSRRFLLNWVLANAISEFVIELGLVAYHHTGQLLDVPQLIVSLIVPGLATWFVLKQQLPELRWQTWVGWTAVAGLASLFSAAMIALALALAFGFSPHTLGEYAILLVALIVGAAVFGLIQWRVLRRFLPRLRRWVWVLANVGASVTMFLITSPVGATPVNTALHDVSSIILATVSAIGEAITGLVLVQQLWVDRASVDA